MKFLAIAVVLSACVPEPDDGPGVAGTPADVKTPAGDYNGYRVVTQCQGTWTDVGVIGTGSVAVTGQDAINLAGQDLHERLTDLASLWGWGGYSLACESGAGTSIDLADWRDVDTVIARTGAWLVEHDYALQVGISVGGWPVPDRN